jgi:elongation factor Tu
MSAFARTITPFIKTARSALLHGNSVSPLQHALRRKNGAQVINAFRSYAVAFERTKPHVNIGMLNDSAVLLKLSLMPCRYNWPR